MMPSADLNVGLEHVFNYDNIAIVVLMVILVMSVMLIFWLLRIVTVYFPKNQQTITNLALAINTLNERLGKHD